MDRGYFKRSKQVVTIKTERTTKGLAKCGLECVTNEKKNSFQCCIKDEGGALHIRLAGGVYKPLHGAVIKSYGIER